jgi:hypothetical protein
MLVWTEMDYRLDICRVTKGAHIESLWGSKKLWFITYLLVQIFLKKVQSFSDTLYINQIVLKISELGD